MYRWGLGEYVEAERRGLTPEEQERLVGKIIDEKEID